MKVFSDDSVVPYKETEKSPEVSRAEIDGLLARWGIKKSGWDWDLENGVVALHFQFVETVGGVQVAPVILVKPPFIYDKATRKKPEQVNWRVSMRVLHWWLKTHLEMAYLSQSSKTEYFLPLIEASDGKHTLKDAVIPKLEFFQNSLALEAPR